MKKKIIRITENDLTDIIEESVRKVLIGSSNFAFDIDIRQIPLEDLKAAYKDLRLVPVSTYYGHPLHNPIEIKEAVGDSFPPEKAIIDILSKYGLPESMAIRKEHFHKIFVYIIVASVGINDKIIEDDMAKMGYFVSVKGEPIDIGGMSFQTLQFEPQCQLQEDVTEEIKKQTHILYYWTPSYNVEKLLHDGLIPNHQNSLFKYPPRTYLIDGNADIHNISVLGQMLCTANRNPKNDGNYTLMVINITDIDDSIRFYYDPNSEIGLYTEQPIPPNAIQRGGSEKFTIDPRIKNGQP